VRANIQTAFGWIPRFGEPLPAATVSVCRRFGPVAKNGVALAIHANDTNHGQEFENTLTNAFAIKHEDLLNHEQRYVVANSRQNTISPDVFKPVR